MRLTGHLTESMYRRYAIVSEADLGAGVEKLAELTTGTIRGTKSGKGASGGSGQRPNSRGYNNFHNEPGWRNWQTHRT